MAQVKGYYRVGPGGKRVYVKAHRRSGLTQGVVPKRRKWTTHATFGSKHPSSAKSFSEMLKLSESYFGKTTTRRSPEAAAKVARRLKQQYPFYETRVRRHGKAKKTRHYTIEYRKRRDKKFWMQ